jgi:hypothetical protein
LLLTNFVSGTRKKETKQSSKNQTNARPRERLRGLKYLSSQGALQLCHRAQSQAWENSFATTLT